jgi:hypothetical protein
VYRPVSDLDRYNVIRKLQHTSGTETAMVTSGLVFRSAVYTRHDVTWFVEWMLVHSKLITFSTSYRSFIFFSVELHYQFVDYVLHAVFLP